MDLRKIINTIRYLKPKQLFYQLYYRLRKCPFEYQIKNPYINRVLKFSFWIPKFDSNFSQDKFNFINIPTRFTGWDFSENGNLWAYNLNYMDFLIQSNMHFELGEIWINKFINEIDHNSVGLDPYPIALRGINWIKFISSHFDKIPSTTLKEWNNSLYSQFKLLLRRLEYHLLGNHLLEDAYSLFIASLYFNDFEFYSKSAKILGHQLKEQILEDGAHYEQSPMYHCILLDRLLDCYNFSINNSIFASQPTINQILRESAEKMLGHLEVIIYKDGSIPLLNDSAFKIAPEPQHIFDYAKRLGLDWEPIPLSDSGYRKYNDGKIEVICDIGDIKASYQPGHSHADTFNFELRVNGKPFIIDTGISTYEKNSRRQYERSTAAHNTVSFKDRDSSEVWGGFRVGNRAFVTIIEDSKKRIKAFHNGFGEKAIHTRTLDFENGLEILDEVESDSTAISYLHFAPGTEIREYNKELISTECCDINLKGAINIQITEGFASKEYNKLEKIKVAKISFKKQLRCKFVVK